MATKIGHVDRKSQSSLVFVKKNGDVFETARNTKGRKPKREKDHRSNVMDGVKKRKSTKKKATKKKK